MKNSNHFETLKAVTRGAEFSANLSPAESLILQTRAGDGEDWGDFETFSVGDLVVSNSDRVYKVIGFTLKNTLICTPYGLGHDSAVRFYEMNSVGLSHVSEPVCGSVSLEV